MLSLSTWCAQSWGGRRAAGALREGSARVRALRAGSAGERGIAIARRQRRPSACWTVTHRAFFGISSGCSFILPH
eukprot:3018401-Prymnesium_polylepis.1